MSETNKKSNIRKSPWWPTLLSALVAPGVGQIFNRDYAKGIFLLVASVVSFGWFSKVVTERLGQLLPGSADQWVQNQTAMREAMVKLINQQSDMFFTFEILVLVIWGYGVVDAYFTARKKFRVLPDENNENSNPVG